MNDLGTALCGFRPEGIGFLGNPVTHVSVYKNGIAIERKKGTESYAFADIDKITAGNYASPTPIYIFISIVIKGVKKAIEFKLHPDLKDADALLNAYADLQETITAFIT